MVCPPVTGKAFISSEDADVLGRLHSARMPKTLSLKLVATQPVAFLVSGKMDKVEGKSTQWQRPPVHQN